MAQETLSALFDGECSPQELDRLLDQMERDPALKEAWSRLCLARDAVEGTRYRAGQPDICAGVMAALAPVATAPVRAAAPPAGFVRSMRSAFQRRRREWAPMAGWAVAASVAVVAVTLNYGDRGGEGAGGGGGGMSPQVQTSPVLVPAVQRRPRYLQAVSAHSEPAPDAAQEDLRQYLIEHSNTLADRGMGGSLSYARFAAHTAEYRPEPAAASATAAEPEGQP